MKRWDDSRIVDELVQPPSGGCVLKLVEVLDSLFDVRPAAFRRLCVETIC